VCRRGRGTQPNSLTLADASRVADPGRFTDPAPHSGAGGLPTNGDQMTTTVEEPVAGYNDLNTKEAVASLSNHSQVELAEIESYEKAHEAREPVFDKLRWLRHDEPLPGFDALDVEEVIAALDKEDLEGLKRVRGYERKFGVRKDVLDEIDRLYQERKVPLVSRDAASR
jgi:hypothetical protein